jgi:pyridoxamine 5'-phosphate oxidase
MNLRDMPPALDDPVDALFGFHRRLERDLAALGRLPTHIECCGIDATASATAGGLLHGLGAAAALHHAQEEHELMPLLERRIARPGEREAFRALRQGLEADHREIELLWRSLRRPLEAVAEGLARKLPIEDIQHFRAIWTTHISAEEASLHLLALRHLPPADRNVLAQRIRARRSRGLRAA